jgi:hypothetical protein
MPSLRKLARGRQCEVRIPEVCNRDNDTVVLCHLPGGGIGSKRHDIHAALACSACHDAVDHRTPVKIPSDTLSLYFHEGVIRTQQIWINEGLL